MKVRYKSDLGCYDKLEKGQEYDVVKTLPSHYVVLDNTGNKKTMPKGKFDIVKESC